eukprot:scaffold214477_cov17-Tisochrysis_lutea.AAC.1
MGMQLEPGANAARVQHALWAVVLTRCAQRSEQVDIKGGDREMYVLHIRQTFSPVDVLFRPNCILDSPLVWMQHACRNFSAHTLYHALGPTWGLFDVHELRNKLQRQIRWSFTTITCNLLLQLEMPVEGEEGDCQRDLGLD